MIVWLVGAGGMAANYAKVFEALKVHYLVIGRGDSSASKFEGSLGVKVYRGGLERMLSLQGSSLPDCAVIAVGVEALAPVTALALRSGIKRVLVEKPAGLNAAQICGVKDLASHVQAEVFVAFNRRFYSSVLTAQGIIDDDGGVSSFTFEFTELSDEVTKLQKGPGVKEKWLLANSSHVIDLAFHLGGDPEQLYTIRSGSLPWHPSAAVFVGAGRAKSGALFSYHANWWSAGRWGVEVNTTRTRLIFRPIETLQVMKKGSLSVEAIETKDSEIDSKFKPGLFKQVNSFLFGDGQSRLCTIGEHVARMPIYERIGGYSGSN